TYRRRTWSSPSGLFRRASRRASGSSTRGRSSTRSGDATRASVGRWARPEEEPARCRARPQGRQASVGDHDRRRAQRPRKEGGAGAVDKSTQTGIGLSTEEYEEEREAPWSYPRESTSSTELFRRPA